MAEATVKTETMLDQLVAGKREALTAQQAIEPLAPLQQRACTTPLPLPFAEALRGPCVRLIAEIKRASPVKGVLAAEFDPAERAKTYAAGGAAAISILTEEKRFLGRLDDLTRVRDSLGRGNIHPVLLRKDFLFDAYQLYEARAAGADAILLIVAILEQAALVDLLALARELGLGALVEVHDEREIERALQAGADVIGINNRDLRSFQIDLGVSLRLRPLIPTDGVVVSESGISRRQDVDRLGQQGVDAILVGEALMRSGDLTSTLAALTSSPKLAVPVP
ncbi:MAG: indole-3-glycerol phosphate synthase TrpC [Dehalococcoidia bacterium]